MLTAVLGAFALLLALPVILEVVSLIRRPVRRGPTARSGEPPFLLFLIPAHNEEGLIGDCVRSVLAMDYPALRRRVIVIADNSTDATAAIARREGAECLERRDPDNPGKPRALAWALAQLSHETWDACVIIDADSTVHPGFGTALAAFAPLDDKALQAYFGTLNETESWLTRLAGVLTRGRYEVTYPLKMRVGLNCPLTGNGMCLGRRLFGPEGWTALSLTENWELYAEYTARGIPVLLAQDARLYSQEAATMRLGRTQRRRWLAGRLGVLRAWGGRILASPRIGLHQKLDALVELGGLSPVLQLVAALAVVVAALALLPGPAGAAVAAVALLSLAGLVVTTVVVLLRHPDPWPTLAAFAMLPAYALWRSGLALKTVFTLRGLTWRRSERG